MIVICKSVLKLTQKFVPIRILMQKSKPVAVPVAVQ